MPSPLNKSAEDALTLFRHHQALASSHVRHAESAMKQFLAAVSYSDGAVIPTKGPRCVAVWTKWLTEHGPNTRPYITEATGTKFTERGTPHTLRWDDVSDSTDDEVPANTIIRFIGPGRSDGGRGAPKTIYALWSQRFDVRPKFGVGPERPDETDSTPEELAKQWDDGEPAAMTGVIRPPVQSPHALVDGPWDEQALDLREGIPEILLTAEDLDDDGVVPTVSEPTEFDHVAWAERIIAERESQSNEDGESNG